MIITNKLKLDLQTPGTTPTVNAVQNDSYSRNLEIALFSDHRPFAFPEKVTVVIRYKKSDGKGGEYDTLPDGTTAWWTERNILTVALAPQVLTTPGSVLLSVSLIADGKQLSIFPIRLSVEPIAASKLAKSEDYFYITGLLPAPFSGNVGQYLRIAAINGKGRITAVEAADIDYWTSTDKESIVQDVLDALGTPEFGNVDLTGYAKEQWVQENYQPKGKYLTEVPDGYAKTEDIPRKPEDVGAQPAGNYLTEVPSGYATEEFVKNKIAEAELGGEEVDLSGYAQKSELPTKVSQLENDSGYLTEHQDISGKLDASELPAAINTALVQAKANGEFDGSDGQDGYTPVRGTDYWTSADIAEIKSYVDEAILGGAW